MTLQQLLVQGTEQLNNAGVPGAELDARYLLLEAFGMGLSSFLANRGRNVDEVPDGASKAEAFSTLIARRAERIPLQQLLGVQEFMGLEFFVNEHVLIPRQDTETLVELVLEEQKRRDISVLDVCTGSGCIAISLARLGGYERVTALDVSGEALKAAKKNADVLLADYSGSFRLIQSDMFAGLEPEGAEIPRALGAAQFDVLVSNPPYIPSQVINGLEPEVRDFEPRLALDGSPDGLKFYRILAAEGKRFLRSGGAMYLEIGWDQAEAVSGLLEAEGFTGIRTVKDMAGLNRVVRAGWP